MPDNAYLQAAEAALSGEYVIGELLGGDDLFDALRLLGRYPDAWLLADDVFDDCTELRCLLMCFAAAMRETGDL